VGGEREEALGTESLKGRFFLRYGLEKRIIRPRGGHTNTKETVHRGKTGHAREKEKKSGFRRNRSKRKIQGEESGTDPFQNGSLRRDEDWIGQKRKTSEPGGLCPPKRSSGSLLTET